MPCGVTRTVRATRCRLPHHRYLKFRNTIHASQSNLSSYGTEQDAADAAKEDKRRGVADATASSGQAPTGGGRTAVAERALAQEDLRQPESCDASSSSVMESGGRTALPPPHPQERRGAPGTLR
ncbi:hypothetical protein V7S43_000449 [Phytophthora oleae]|uniref:Uncharacterized protein n=1 Tax=Phytophthora oleae TaxID=2107226 RepID=A0ABD3G999_9STRA